MACHRLGSQNTVRVEWCSTLGLYQSGLEVRMFSALLLSRYALRDEVLFSCCPAADFEIIFTARLAPVTRTVARRTSSDTVVLQSSSGLPLQ